MAEYGEKMESAPQDSGSFSATPQESKEKMVEDTISQDCDSNAMIEETAAASKFLEALNHQGESGDTAFKNPCNVKEDFFNDGNENMEFANLETPANIFHDTNDVLGLAMKEGYFRGEVIVNEEQSNLYGFSYEVPKVAEERENQDLSPLQACKNISPRADSGERKFKGTKGFDCDGADFKKEKRSKKEKLEKKERSKDEKFGKKERELRKMEKGKKQKIKIEEEKNPRENKKEKKEKNLEGSEKKTAGPKKGSGGRPTLTSKFNDLTKQFEELKRSLTQKKKKNPIKAPNMGFKIPKVLKDRPTQDPFPKLFKTETNTTKQPHDPTIPNPIKTKTSKMPPPQIPNHPPVQALNSRKIRRHPEENTKPLDIFQEEDPALKPILIVCDLFIKENMDKMIEQYGLRHGTDQIGWSAPRKRLFIVKFVDDQENFSYYSLKLIRKSPFLGYPVTAKYFMNKAPNKLPSTVKFCKNWAPKK